MCKGGGKPRKPFPFEVVPGGKALDLRPGAINHIQSVDECAKLSCEIAAAFPIDFNPKPLDCSAGDRPRVMISDTTALLMAEAFIDMANAKLLFVDNLEASEAITRAFGEIELLQKVIENDGNNQRA